MYLHTYEDMTVGAIQDLAEVFGSTHIRMYSIGYEEGLLARINSPLGQCARAHLFNVAISQWLCVSCYIDEVGCQDEGTLCLRGRDWKADVT